MTEVVNTINWSDVAYQAFTYVLAPVLALLGGFLIAAVKTWINERTAKIKDEKVRQRLQELTNIIITAIASTAQTYVDSLKKAGKFTEAEQKIAFEKAKETALVFITVESRQFISNIYGDFDKWIEAKIEELVRQDKATQVAAKATVALPVTEYTITAPSVADTDSMAESVANVLLQKAQTAPQGPGNNG